MNISEYKIIRELGLNLNYRIDFHSSFFEIKNIEQNNCIINLIDLLDTKKLIQLIDIGMSLTGRPGQILFCRLLPMENNIYITSGASFLYENKDKAKLLN